MPKGIPLEALNEARNFVETFLKWNNLNSIFSNF
jgi:hypothetical protein